MIECVNTIMPDFNLGLQYVEIDRNLFVQDEYTKKHDQHSDSSELFSEEQKKQDFYDKAKGISKIDQNNEKEAAENESI